MTRISWGDPSERFYESGIDRGVLYLSPRKERSSSIQPTGAGSKTFVFSTPVLTAFPTGIVLQAQNIASGSYMQGIVTASTTTQVVVNVDTAYGSGTFSDWVIAQVTSVSWNGLTSVDEGGADGAAAYYIDGRPFLFLPKPKEYTASIKAYTYPDEFSSVMGVGETSADGLYLDSQLGDSFSLSYRTLVGNASEGIDFGYKIHLVYNATVAPQSLSYSSLTNQINPIEFEWQIQAVPVRVDGYRPTAHVIIDTRKMDSVKLGELEDILYGTTTSAPRMPSAQEVFDLLNYGDLIIVRDMGDGTWTAEGSFHNIYMTGDGTFEIDNVNAVDNSDGTFTISDGGNTEVIPAP